MWEGNYAEEPLDKKLFWLGLVKRIWVILLAAAAGMLLLGGGYFLGAVVFAGEREYHATGEVFIEYIPEEGYGISTVCLNEKIWKALITSDSFLEDMTNQLTGAGYEVSRDMLEKSVDAALERESRIVTVHAVTGDPELSQAIAKAAQNAVIHFGETYKDINYSVVLRHVRSAEPVLTGEWQTHMLVLGGILGGFFSFLCLGLYLALDDSVQVPEHLEKRYGIPAFGVWGMPETEENLAYVIGEKNPGVKELLLVGTEQDIPMEKLAEELAGRMYAGGKGEWKFDVLKGLPEGEDALEKCRKAKGIILVAEADRRDGKRIGRMVDLLRMQKLEAAGAILWNADEKLLKAYYSASGPKKRGSRK